MNSTERVRNIILGKPVDRQPLYGWVSANLKDQITERWGSVAAFEDKYEFDMAHIFGGPRVFSKSTLARIREENDGEVPPDVLLETDYSHSVDDPAAWDKVKRSIAHHKERGRFCYVQTPGFFECFNDAFGIENHPDNGCNFELYLAKDFMELESLGVVTTLRPGEAATHTETWQLEKL